MGHKQTYMRPKAFFKGSARRRRINTKDSENGQKTQKMGVPQSLERKGE